MSLDIIAEIEASFAKLKAALTPAAEVVKTDVEAVASASWSYIKENSLQDAYQIALVAVQAAVAGTPWVSVLATIEAQVIAAGKTIEKGAVAIIGAQAQADLIAVGTLLPPVSSPVA